MRFSVIFAAVLATAASAASLTVRDGNHNFPGCAVKCLIESDRGHCKDHPTMTCLCHDGDFRGDTRRCIKNACNNNDQNDAIKYIDSIC